MWSECSQALLAKIIGELCFEQRLVPEPGYVLRFSDSVYRFSASRTAFDGWVVEPGSVFRAASGILGDDVEEPCDDVQQFVVDACRHMGIDGQTTAGWLSEITSTLAADVAMASTAISVAELTSLSHIELDGHLTGHPWLVANKGRVGFSASDVSRYAPESRTPIRLSWLAAHRGLAEFRGTSSSSEQSVVSEELDEATRHRFTETLREAGRDPAAYVWLPVHPWQLDHVVRTLWAPQLASFGLVELGSSPDRYLPTQSVRTMSNVDRPSAAQVKLPLRILNTAVYRGIPPHCSLSAPVVTQWMQGLWSNDKLLTEWGTGLLGEYASVTVRHPHLSRAGDVPYQWLETLGCIWREPLAPHIGPGNTAWSLAAVLHTDPSGAPLVGEFIRLSGLSTSEWLAALLRVLLRPLLHVLYTYGITVNPHGENVTIVCSDGVPVRAVIHDLVDDVNVSVERIPERGLEPDSHDRVLPRKHWNVLRQYLVDALLVGVFRPLELLTGQANFWGMVRGEIEAYRKRHPHLAARMDAGTLLGPTFTRFPLNGYRLTLGYRDLAQRPPIPSAGEVPNPMHTAPAVAPLDGW
ncbi:rhizobactin siderophore biosynthesis protein RhbF [Lentzea sp. NBRC 105346]|uniref:IucA/IucC family protein n=1 Tax=Lentzea sp. NBRC 105346 TaxID=3032205 RepID=UPI0024A17F39|nr:IucA/IucC family protein [Lentzea sp. NBRC 105346]GLZ36111.1 rhizobactin siderophore biosynthesis protein RhbF [Lentzea sp. NBRC 105346]